MFRIENISKRFSSGAEPIHHLSAVINKGDVISLIGPSGTGKSTLLRCLNMLDPPTEGDIYYGEDRITAKGYDLTKLRQKVGMVFQSFNLFSHLTAIENIMMPQVRLLGRNRQEAFDKSMALLTQVGLKEKYLQYPSQLSGGQKQRVAIARAMGMDPETLLLDEPTSALDPSMVDDVNAVIKTLVSSGMTILTVTHDMTFARDISNRVFYMDEGIVYEDGTTEDIFENPKKPKTIQFIKKLFVLEEDICDRGFDFADLTKRVYELMIQTKSFGNIWNNAILLLDEVIHQVLFSILDDPFRIHLKMECKKNSILLNFDYSGKAVDAAALIRESANAPLDRENDSELLPFSARVICGFAQDMSYSYHGGELGNHLEIQVRETGRK